MAYSPIPATLSRLDAILKDRPLLDYVLDALNKATAWAEEITQELTLSGRQGIFPAQFGVNEAIYARADNTAFGNAQTPQPKLAKVTAKAVYAIFEITGMTMSATRDTAGAFEDSLALQIENTVDGLKMDMGRQYIGDGFGVMGVVQDRASATDFDLWKPFGIGRELGGTQATDTKYLTPQTPVKHIFRVDREFDGFDATDFSTLNFVGQVSAISHTNPVGTTDGWSDVTVAAGYTETAALAVDDIIVTQGNYGLEVQGFLAAVADGVTGPAAPYLTYLNIARSGQEGWQGVLTDASGGGASAVPLEPNDLRDHIDLVSERCGERPSFMLGNYKQRRNVYNLSAPQIRYGPMNAEQGLDEDTVKFDNMRYVVDRFFPPQHIGFPNVKYWYHAIDKDVEWIQAGDGSVLHPMVITGFDKYRAVLKTYRDCVCLYPGTQGLLWGLSEA
jgi:hypothetical protein